MLVKGIRENNGPVTDGQKSIYMYISSSGNRYILEKEKEVDMC